MSKLDEMRDEIRSDPTLGRRMAKYGAVGAVLAIPLPFVGPIIGAAVGAAVAYSRRDKG
ncbi:hypothetical protein [Sphingomonas sp.]|uniref:hypothetical protein n=1 Tax=Sphingomonas sp. TaxID=28214 RepID=UPI003B0089A2